MSKVSIIIPSRNEKYLSRTVDEVFNKAKGDFEVIVILDGKSDYPIPKRRKGLSFIRKSKPEGLRTALNQAVGKAKGKYICKVDAHVLLSEGFNEVLKQSCNYNWVAVSRFYQINPDTWKPYFHDPSDYFYINCPWTHPKVFLFRIWPWRSRDFTRRHYRIDDNMVIQASLWFMHKEHYQQRIGNLDVSKWGNWSCEQLEITLKTWLGGGRVVVNKDAWNAHYSRPYKERVEIQPEYSRAKDWLIFRRFTKYWVSNKWEKRVHDFEWLIGKFWPLPTKKNKLIRERHYWPENWLEYCHKEANLCK